MYDDIITKIENRTFTMTEVNFVLYVFYIPVYNFPNLHHLNSNNPASFVIVIFSHVTQRWATLFLLSGHINNEFGLCGAVQVPIKPV